MARLLNQAFIIHYYVILFFIFSSEHGCFSRTCDDIIVQTSLADCTGDLCGLFGYNTTCNYTYIGRVSVETVGS